MKNAKMKNPYKTLVQEISQYSSPNGNRRLYSFDKIIIIGYTAFGNEDVLSINPDNTLIADPEELKAVVEAANCKRYIGTLNDTWVVGDRLRERKDGLIVYEGIIESISETDMVTFKDGRRVHLDTLRPTLEVEKRSTCLWEYYGNGTGWLLVELDLL